MKVYNVIFTTIRQMSRRDDDGNFSVTDVEVETDVRTFADRKKAEEALTFHYVTSVVTAKQAGFDDIEGEHNDRTSAVLTVVSDGSTGRVKGEVKCTWTLSEATVDEK